MLEIKHSKDVPDSTYFRVGDAEPIVGRDGSLTLLDGKGSRRGWGAPGVTSTLVFQDCDLVAVHIGFHHKHGGGQFWRYYTTDGETIRQVAWAKLPDETRQNILDAAKVKAPSWAKEPGKLRAEYSKPNTRKLTTYKVVALEGDRMLSLYDGRTLYQIGTRLTKAVAEDAGIDDWGEIKHDGGYYSHPTPEAVLKLLAGGNLVPKSCLEGVDTVALLECEASGRIARFPNGKIASTYIKPIRVLDTISL